MEFSIKIIYSTATLLQEQWNSHLARCSYWRLYYNQEEGAVIEFEGETFPLSPDTIVLIPPETQFKVSLSRPVRHYFIHFNLSKNFLAKPGVYSMKDKDSIELIHKVQSCSKESTHEKALLLAKLISSTCLKIDEEVWKKPVSDRRFIGVIKILEKDLAQRISNESLAKTAKMTPNGFIRRFRQLFNTSPQSYHLKKRLDHACHLLGYSNDSIEQIAGDCGFCDRNYFTAVFRKNIGLAPVEYRNSRRALQVT